MRVTVPGGIALAVHVIVVGLLERGGQVGQPPIGRIHNHGLATRFVVERLLPFNVEGRHDRGVAPDALQVGMTVGLPRRFEFRGLPECRQRNQKECESHRKSLPAYLGQLASSTRFIPVDWYGRYGGVPEEREESDEVTAGRTARPSAPHGQG